jgi:hypothetical protein
MRVASAGVIDREASFIYVYMRCARDVSKREPDRIPAEDMAGKIETMVKPIFLNAGE